MKTQHQSTTCMVFSRLTEYFGCIPQSVLFGRFVERRLTACFFALRHAERPENTASFLYGDASHSLRWNGVASAFLQSAQTPMAASALCESASTKRRLSGQRYDSSPSIYHHGRTTA